MKWIQTWFGAAAFCWLLFTFNTHATTHYVDANGANPASPYADWSTAATNIQDAIDASTDGDLVLVTNGVYATGGRVVYGSLANRVVINKAVTVQSVNGPNSTIIQGYQANVLLGIRCCYLTNGAALTGFTLTSGGTLGRVADVWREESGAGVWCENGGAIISNCVLSGNSAYGLGGGAFCGTLIHCVLTNNTAGSGNYGGGGACSNILLGCVLAKNRGSQVGGAIYCTLSNCLVVGNSASPGSGGGLGSSTAYNCIISNNTANFSDGGGTINSTLRNCLLVANSCSGNGGGAYSNVLSNCVLINNHATTGGGAYGSTLVNCTIVSNAASSSGGGVYYFGSLTNCVLYYNASTKYPNFSTDFSAAMDSCDTFPLATGFGNITNEPEFANLANGDFHLQSNSPCINAGNNAYVSGTNDLDGNPRIVGGTVDIGAYEYQSPGSTLSYAWEQQYGLPTDGSADTMDTDGDGMNNYAEWKAGTIPTNALSLLQLESPVSTNSPAGIVVTWQSVANVTYYLQRSSDLTQSFSSVQSNLVGQAGFTRYTDTSATNSGPYFYQVGVQ